MANVTFRPLLRTPSAKTLIKIFTIHLTLHHHDYHVSEIIFFRPPAHKFDFCITLSTKNQI